MKNSNIPAPGKTPRGKGGTRPLDHPGCGKSAGSVNNTIPSPTKPGGGALPKSMGGGERKGFYPNAPHLRKESPPRSPKDKW